MTPNEFLQKYKRDCFYHFTDLRNLPSIREHGGLFPRAILRARGIPIPSPGGNQWSHEADDRNGLDAYVHLCLVDTHPMEFKARNEGRIAETTFLQIDSKVLNTDGAAFSDRVANQSEARLLAPSEAFETLDFDALFTFMDWKDPAVMARVLMARKYELLIPTPIPLSMILGGL